MKQVKREWTFMKHFLLSLSITALALLSDIITGLGSFAYRLCKLSGGIPFFGRNEASSIGIIGGSDGPTQIYLGGGNLLNLILNQYVILFLILLVLYKPLKYLLRKVYLANKNA